MSLTPQRRIGRRIGRWQYGNHPGLNPGWRLDGTDLVLDFDPHDSGGPLRGAYVLWRGGRPGDPIDHYLQGAMEYVEAFGKRGWGVRSRHE